MDIGLIRFFYCYSGKNRGSFIVVLKVFRYLSLWWQIISNKISKIYLLSRGIGEAVLRHRKAAGLTRSELSELSGVGATAIYQIENGHPTVRLETLVSVLDVLNIKLRLSSSLEGEIS
ncbi:MAG: helix-turn-helix domain-containing protein [Vulcanimicrobiota bacterium]